MKRFLTPLFSLALLILAAGSVTGCSSSHRIISNGLELEITGIESASDGTVAVSWRIKNSNVVAYLFSHLSHKIQLNGVPLGVIEEREALGVPASSEAGRTSKLIPQDAAAARAITEAVNAGSGNYHIDTQITILVYDDAKEKSVISGSGTVPVKASNHS